MARERIARAGEPTDSVGLWVKVRPQTREALRSLARRRGTSMNALIRELIDAHLDTTAVADATRRGAR